MDTNKHLAQNMIALRNTRHMTQAGLAKLSGVPRSTIAHIETGDANPSLRNLCRLSAALQVGLESLLAAPRARIQKIPAHRIPLSLRARGLARVYKLLPDPVPGMEIDRFEIDPGGRMVGMPHLPHTREYLTCLTGEVLVRIGEAEYDIAEGDVITFAGDQQHIYHNQMDQTAVCVSVVVLAPV